MPRNLQEMLSNIVSSSEGDVSMDLAVERPIEKALIIVVTSDRGLCGGYNSNLIKLAKQPSSRNMQAKMPKEMFRYCQLERKDMSILPKTVLK
jgi:F-type H+-transporting ATPase subunit gamma